MALLWGAAIPAHLRRGLKSGSFASFIKAIDRPGCLGIQHEDFRTKLVKQSRYLNESANSYRDKRVEHLRSLADDTGLEVGETIRKLHTRQRQNGKLEAAKPPAGYGYMVVNSPEREIYQLHVVPRHPAGDLVIPVQRGEFIGFIADDTGHFDRYGSHTHILSSAHYPTALFRERAALCVPLEVVSESPDAQDLTAELDKYVAMSLYGLKQLILGQTP